MNLKIISAGAGSGKTYRLTQEMVGLLATGTVPPDGIIATTFTNKAAAELQDRVRVKLLEEGMAASANELGNALIGTVHGLGVKLLKRFSFEAGVSPQVDIMADTDQQVMFNQSLAMVLTNERVGEMESLSEKLGFNKSPFSATDWRKLLLQLTEIARSNNFTEEVLDKSKQQSVASFYEYLDEVTDWKPITWNAHLKEELDNAILKLENNEDTTKVTANGVKSLKEVRAELELRGELFWHQWAKLTKLKVGASSKDEILWLVEFANKHLQHEGFHQDIKSFIYHLFDIAKMAIKEYGNYKVSRGLIDYTDMEVLVNELLDNELVKSCLQEEIDLLMVDEFQDTSPLQLEIFLKLSRLSKYAIWVGDPKQSIYGFRGAEPQLMQAIIEKVGGLKKENILEHSWRSRQDIVHACNAIFLEAFDEMDVEQVALKPKRCKTASATSANKLDEPENIDNALIHWHFEYDGEGRKPGRAWVNQCIADSVKRLLERAPIILPKGAENYRRIQPGDIAILCRSNNNCLDVADALHAAGLHVTISRAGLLSTAEAKLILACLKFILNPYDALSVSEIRLLATAEEISKVVADRLQFLEIGSGQGSSNFWGGDNQFVAKLHSIRKESIELSSAELLNLVLDEMELRRIIAGWGNIEQRLANVDILINLAYQYEEACNRMHTAASLGGFLLWLFELENKELDMQGAGESSNAVNVLTYHKSKGLEYPVVVCHSLDQPLRDDVWGLNIVRETNAIDLDNLLGNRWLRLWVNPYSDQFQGTVLSDRIEESLAKKEKRKEAISEEARLFYVGATRARDYLILPTYHKPPLWLNRVCNNGNETNNILSTSADISPWFWDDHELPISTEVFHYSASFGQIEKLEEAVFFLDVPSGGREYENYFIKDREEKSVSFTFEKVNYRSPLILPEVIERQIVGRAIVAFLNADLHEKTEEEIKVIAKRHIQTFDVESLVKQDELVDIKRAFGNWMEGLGIKQELLQNYPLSAHFDGRFYQTRVDLIGIDDSEVIIILNSPFVGEYKAHSKHLLDLSAKISLIKSTFQQLFPNKRSIVYIHFVLAGVIYFTK